MNIVKWLFCAILVYIFYNTLRRNYKSFKKNDMKYDKDAVYIPKHLCTTSHIDEEAYSQKLIDESAYKTIRWNDIISWEYGFVTHESFNHTVWLSIVTANEKISVTDVYPVKMKRNFKKYIKEKQIFNFSNKLEIWGMLISFAIIAVISYFVFLRS